MNCGRYWQRHSALSQAWFNASDLDVAGLRDAEIKRWTGTKSIYFSRGHIEVKAAKATSTTPNCSLEYCRQELTWSGNLIPLASNLALRRSVIPSSPEQFLQRKSQ